MQSTGLQELEQIPGVDGWQPQIRRIWGWFLSEIRATSDEISESQTKIRRSFSVDGLLPAILGELQGQGITKCSRVGKSNWREPRQHAVAWPTWT